MTSRCRAHGLGDLLSSYDQRDVYAAINISSSLVISAAAGSTTWAQSCGRHCRRCAVRPAAVARASNTSDHLGESRAGVIMLRDLALGENATINAVEIVCDCLRRRASQNLHALFRSMTVDGLDVLISSVVPMVVALKSRRADRRAGARDRLVRWRRHSSCRECVFVSGVGTQMSTASIPAISGNVRRRAEASALCRLNWSGSDAMDVGLSCIHADDLGRVDIEAVTRKRSFVEEQSERKTYVGRVR